MKMVRLDLPEFVFLDGSEHEKGGNPLKGRNVIMHVRSATILEVFERDNVVLNDNVLTFKFMNTIEPGGVKERLIMALHYSALLDGQADSRMIVEEVMKPAAKWYCDNCDWLDKHTLDDFL